MKSRSKGLRGVLMIVLLLILLSSFAFARPVTDVFAGSLLQINSFFESRAYEPYSKTIDFFFFALLFIAIYMMGARYAFKEIKRPEQVIVILLGLMTAFLLVLADISATVLLPYIHWLLYLLLFILYWHLLKGIKNPFWRFVLALLLTLLTIGLIQGLYNYLKAPKISGISAPSAPSFGIGGFFKDLFGSFRGISLPGVSAPGLPDWAKNLFGGVSVTAPTGPSGLPQVTTPIGTTPVTPSSPGGPSRWSWWYLLPLLLLLLLIPQVRSGLGSLWNRRPRRGTPAQQQDKLREIISQKTQAKETINRTVGLINHLLRQAEAKSAYISRLTAISDEDIVKLLLDESTDLVNQEQGAVKQIFENEREFFKTLKSLGAVELDILNNLIASWEQRIEALQDNAKKEQGKNIIAELRKLISEKGDSDETIGIIWIIAACHNFKELPAILLSRTPSNLFDSEYIKELVIGRKKESVNALADENRALGHLVVESGGAGVLIEKLTEQIDYLNQLLPILQVAQQGTEPQDTSTPLKDIELVLAEIKEAHNKKYAILLKILDLYKKKKALKDRIDEYHKRLYNIINGKARGKNESGEDVSYILDPDSDLHRELESSNSDIDKVIKLEFEVAIALKDFIKMENEILGNESRGERGKIHEWLDAIIDRFIKSDEYLKTQSEQYAKYARILHMYLKDGVQNITRAARNSAIDFFKITGTKIKAEKELQDLLDENKIAEIIKHVALDRWIKLVQMKDIESQEGSGDFEKFRNFVSNDKYQKGEAHYLKPGKDKRAWDIFKRNEGFWSNGLFVRINHQKKILKSIYLLIRLLQKIGIKAIMQNLVISKEVEEEGTRKFVPATEEARTKGFKQGTGIRISTRIASGVNPFDVNMYIYKKTFSDYRLVKKIPGAKYLKKIPGIRSLLGSSQYKPHLPEDYPAVPSRKDFAAEPEYLAAVADFEARRDAYYNNPRFRTEAANVIDEFEFISNGEDGFGNLEPGEYKIIVVIRGDRVVEGQLGKGKGIEFTHEQALDIRAVRRYGWDYKEADLIITREKKKEDEEKPEATPYEQLVYDEIEGERIELEKLKGEVRYLDLPLHTKEEIEEEIRQDVYELVRTKEISVYKDADKIVSEAKKIRRKSRFKGLWKSLADYVSRTKNVKQGVSNFTRGMITNIQERRRRIQEFLKRKVGKRTDVPIRQSPEDDISKLLGIDESELERGGKIGYRGR